MDGMPQLRLALAQVNPRVGDLDGNAVLVLDACREAAERGAHIVALPEMVLNGYPTEDLGFRKSFIEASQKTVAELAQRLDSEGLGHLVVLVGHLDSAVGRVEERVGLPKNLPTNTVSVMTRGRIVSRYDKHHLPNYGVFDEFRHFVPGDECQIIQVGGIDIAIAICEDIWQHGPSAAARAAEAGLLLVVNGSPYEAAKDDARLKLCQDRAAEAGCAVAYVNLCGGQDELVFEGDSMVVAADGTCIARGAQFESDLLVVDLELPAATAPMPDADAEFFGLKARRDVISDDPFPAYEPEPAPPLPERWDALGERYQAIVHGLRDYVTKNGFRSVLLGLSGGIDSALVATISVDALGAENVFCISNPSQWSTDHSKSDAAELARRQGLNFETVAIASMFDAFQEQLKLTGLAEENIQARIRAVIWMGLSNQHGHLVLACGNKSELATGYSTIYGDAVGGFAPIKDLPKTLVWEVARWRNAQAEANGETPPIPEAIIEKPPSAELRPGQLDTDSLPPYELLDAILDAYVERDLGSHAVTDEGFDPAVVEKVIRLVDKAEYKRRQYPPGPKLSRRNFGRDRRVPITNLWRERL
jgi:NAD+ synthase (glutamine-hydrolysing)